MDTAAIRDLCEQAIDLFLEYRDRHGDDETAARAKALDEVRDGLTADLSGLDDEGVSA